MVPSRKQDEERDGEAEAAERDEVGKGDDLGRRVLRGADGTLRGVHCLRLGRVCVGDGLDAPLDSLRSL